VDLPTPFRLRVALAPARASWRRTAFIIAGSAVLFAVCAWPCLRNMPVRWALDGTVTVLYAVAGARLLDGGYSSGRWFVAGGVLWAVTAIRWTDTFATEVVWRGAWGLLWLILGLGCLAYAGDRLRLSAGRARFAVTAGVGTVLLAAITICTALAPRWPPGIPVAEGLSLVTGAAWMVVLTRHSRRLRRADLQLFLPVAIAVKIAGAAMLLTLVLSPDGTTATLDRPAALLVGLVPLAVVVSMIRRRFAHASVAGLLAELASPPTVEGVQAVLRQALHDDTATVLYRLPDVPGYVGADGLRADPPSDQDNRLLVHAVDISRAELATERLGGWFDQPTLPIRVPGRPAGRDAPAGPTPKPVRAHGLPGPDAQPAGAAPVGRPGGLRLADPPAPAPAGAGGTHPGPAAAGSVQVPGPRTAGPAGGEGNRAVADNHTVALVHVDAAMRIHREMVEAAVLTCGPALANARLQVVNRARLNELRTARTRAVEAALGERQRLERDLHDGAQQRLLAVSAQLGAARAVTDDPTTLRAIDDAREQLRTALAELRRLTRGLYPAVLASGGLAAALEASADERSMDVDLDVPGERFDKAVEIAALITIEELLTIAERHCDARRAVVGAAVDRGELRVRIWHDGHAANGAIDSWLMIVVDRLRALDGDLTVSYPGDGRCAQGGQNPPEPAGADAGGVDAGGVVIMVRIPCE
jgi:signal transduction histidine kinase